ncbi:MAG: bifunctional phosphoribosyl-AMP cyclohydrolase/phosphoribosyl-ATP diphosphatase HisIE [Chloroflexi bacterium]|nr:bifunctional phosphoribosyl-AMP cyclohydrolase/phosphoribosyl-ATP diphosphatase HisIE [Chloroflexota bacterium]
MVNFTSSPLLPAIAQDARTGQVLMLAYMNQAALQKTLETGQAWFWSRSRGELWHKGATSGNYLHVREVTADCDGDAILLRVEPAGPACHTGAVSCFFNQVRSGDQTERDLEVMAATRGAPISGPAPEVEEVHPVELLFHTIEDRKARRPQGSYVAGLLEQGTERVAKKVVEEAGEAAIAAVGQSDQRLIEETADLWFHSLMLLSARGLTPTQVWAELAKRRR